jgi:hypothetical protein
VNENETNTAPDFQLDIKLRVNGKLTSENLATIREITKGLRVGDTYTIEGPAGTVGPVHASTVVVQQIVAEASIDQFRDELQAIIETMRQTADSSAGCYQTDLEHLERAQIAAREGDKSKIVDHLKQVGGETLKIAQDIGADLIVKLVGHWLGFPA